MLHAGRIPLNPSERDAVNDLIGTHQGTAISLSRRDPDESGPLLVHIDDDAFEVFADGRCNLTTGTR